MAKKIPYDTSADALLRPAKNATFFENWNADDTKNHDLLCAEMSRLAYAREDKVLRGSLKSIGFELTHRIGADDPATRAETGGTEGFIAASPDEHLTVLAFRGTESDKLEDLITDAMTFQVDTSFSGRVHAGFANRFNRVKDLLPKPIAPANHSFLITGHSLGAAIATLAAIDTQPAKLITFGSPLVGDGQFCQLFEGMDIRRYVDCSDVVARIPPARFNEPELQRLLIELSNPKSIKAPLSDAVEGAIQLVARLIAAAFAIADKTIEFAHVSKARCILADGTIAEGIGELEFQQDQQKARDRYPHRLTNFQSLNFAEIAAVAGRLRNVFGLSPQDALRTFIRELSNLADFGHVLSRDLADHAPINYVSAFTGRSGGL